MLSAHYTEYFRHCGDELHVAAHSHHPWPDVARAAHRQYWEDSARLTNRKWAKIFGEVVPTAQRHVARHRVIDRRGPRVRFGFGVYHDRSFPERLIKRMKQALTP